MLGYRVSWPCETFYSVTCTCAAVSRTTVGHPDDKPLFDRLTVGRIAGQSNMQYTPSSMSGMNNKSAEVAAASGYGDTMRLFTVGMGTNIYETNCSQPYIELNTTTHTRPCANGASCRQNWTRASSKAVGGQAWDTFSAVCWLYGRGNFASIWPNAVLLGAAT